MQLLLDILGMGVGLTLGTWAGFSAGRRFETRRRRLLWLVVPVLAVVWIVDIAGYISARPEISLASLGLMAGLLTGLKYGAFPEIRLWDKSSPRPVAELTEPPAGAPAVDDDGHASAP